MGMDVTLRIRRVTTRPVVVPLSRPIRTASGTIAEAPLLLVDLETDDGVTGRAYLFGYQPFTLGPLAALVHATPVPFETSMAAPRFVQDRPPSVLFRSSGTVSPPLA